MFHLLVGGIAAFNQVGLLIGALLLAAAGAALLGNALYWKLHAVRVQGRLIGVRQSRNCFRSVYRYALPTGQRFEATSTGGSSSLRGRETGATRTLLVMPAHPDRVEEASSHIWTVVGGVFLALGVWLFHMAVTMWPVGPMTWAFGAIFLVHAAVRIRRIVLPAEKRLGAASLRSAFAQMRTSRVEDSPMRTSEEITATPEWRANEARQRAMQRRFSPVLMLAGIALLVGSVFLGRSLVRLESSGLRAPGVIRALEVPNPGTRNPAYYPVVEFTAENGRGVRFRDRSGSNPPSFRIGESVTVLYLADDAHSATTDSAMIDRGMMNWLVPGAVLLFGGVLTAAGMRALRN